jgi:DNA-binding transcriptional regulator YdaS (Cro superfamily)
MNTLLSYIRSHGKAGVQSLADACGTKPVYLSQVARGHRKASHTLANAIEAATQGAVTVHDLRPDIFGPAPGIPPVFTPHLPTEKAA